MERKYSSSKVEWDYIGQLLNAIENQNIRNHVGNALEWYVIKANRYRLFEYILNALTLIVPAVLMIMNSCVSSEDVAGQLIVALLGTVAAAAKSFSKLHDKRICYRRAAEFIKSETVLYIQRVGVYKGEDRDEIFVNNIIEIRREENNSWVDIENDKGTTSKVNHDNITNQKEKTSEKDMMKDK